MGGRAMRLAPPTAALVLGAASLFGCPLALAQDFKLTDAQFSQWLTNGRGAPTQFLDSQLESQLEHLDEICKLTADQREKLELAGRGDIARFRNEEATLRHELVGKTYDQNRLDAVLQQIAPLSQRIQKGLLGEGSLFQKVMAKSLDDAQRLAVERAEMERINYHYQAKMKLFISVLDSTAPMLDEQRKALLELLIKSSRPPKRMARNNYDWYYVLYHASQAPRDEVGKILDPAQMKCFEAAVRQAARYRQMLEQEGLEPDDNGGPGPRNPDAAVPLAVPAIVIGGQ